MFIEVTIAITDKKAMVNTHIISAVQVKDDDLTTLLFHDGSTKKVKESYDWIKSYLPKSEQTNWYGGNLTIGEAEKLEKGRWSNG